MKTLDLSADAAAEALRFKKPVYKTEEICDLLGINRTTLSLYVKYGLIEGRKAGNKYLFFFDELIDFGHRTKGMTISNTPEGIKEAAAIARANRRPRLS